MAGSDSYLGRLDPDVRRRTLITLDRELRGRRVVLVLAPNRDAERETVTGVWLCWAAPDFGTTSDLVVIQIDGYRSGTAYSSSRVVTVDAAPEPGAQPVP